MTDTDDAPTRPLAGRRLLITGASSGIGAATARAAAAAGATVAGIARRAERLDALHEEFGLLPVVGDVTDTSSCKGVVKAGAEALGGIDGLVNSAGMMRPSPISSGDPADWREMFEVNVIGLMAITQAAIPFLRQAQGGSIINISSMSGRRVPSAAGGVYSATKFAVHAIGEALRIELQPAGIRVTTISPGFVATEIFDHQDGPGVEQYRSLASAIGMDPADVAAAVVHALAAPPSVTTIEVAVVPTYQDDGAYAAAVD